MSTLPPLTQSLDDSVNTSVAGGEMETLRSQLDEKERTIEGLQEQQLSWQQTRVELQQEMAALKDRLNVSEVCWEREVCAGEAGEP